MTMDHPEWRHWKKWDATSNLRRMYMFRRRNKRRFRLTRDVGVALRASDPFTRVDYEKLRKVLLGQEVTFFLPGLVGEFQLPLPILHDGFVEDFLTNEVCDVTPQEEVLELPPWVNNKKEGDPG